MNDKVIAKLVGKLSFQTDLSGLQKFERMMDAASRKMQQLEKQASVLTRKLDKLGGNSVSLQRRVASQQRQTNDQFKQSLEHGKLQYAGTRQQLALMVQQGKVAQQQAKTAQQQSRKQIADHKAELARTKVAQAQAAFSLKQEQQRLRIQSEAARVAAAQHRAVAAADRAKIVSLRLQERIERRLNSRSRPTAHKPSAGSQLSNVLQFPKLPTAMATAGFSGGLGGALGAGMMQDGGLAGLWSARFSGALGGASMAIAGMATAAVAAGVALKSFGDAAVSAGQAQQMRQAQFSAITPDGGRAAEGVYNELANFLGLNARATADSYTKGLQGMVDSGMKLSEGQNVMKGILSFGKASNLTNDDTEGVLRALGQMLSKGQLYQEEWGSQFAERMAGAQKMGAETWAEITKSGETGQKASQAFKDAMADGKIAGDKLLQFLVQLSARMESEANRGGKLDIARASIESNRNRVSNIQDANFVAAAEFDNGKLSRSFQKLSASWERFNHDLKPLYEALSGPAARVNDVLTKAVEWARTQIPLVTQLVEDISSYVSGITDSQEMNAVGEQLTRLMSNLDPVFSAWGDLLGAIFGLTQDASVNGLGVTAGTLVLINEFIEGLPPFFDRIDAAVKNIKSKIEGFKSFIGWDEEAQQERRKNYGGVPQWNKPMPKLDNLLPPDRLPGIPDFLNRLNTQPQLSPQPAAKPSASLTDNRTFNVTVNGTNLSPDQIADAIEERTRMVARREFENQIAASMPAFSDSHV